jgi:hypothetical protein
MKTQISSIVLGVNDLEKAVSFYRDGLQFPLGHHTDSIAFFKLSNIELILFPKDHLAHESKVRFEEVETPSISLSSRVSSSSEVNKIVERAISFGAKLTRPASETCYEGYCAYFSDPDGYLWEVVWDPGPKNQSDS